MPGSIPGGDRRRLGDRAGPEPVECRGSLVVSLRLLRAHGGRASVDGARCSRRVDGTVIIPKDFARCNKMRQFAARATVEMPWPSLRRTSPGETKRYKMEHLEHSN